MAESTATTFLGYGDVSGDTVPAGGFTVACDIIDYPDLSSPAERIETTTLSDKGRTYIKGLTEYAEQQFTANYDREKYEAIKAFGDTQKAWCILFTESKSLFWFKGQSHISVSGGGVGDVRKMIITLYPNDEPALDADSTWKEENGSIKKAPGASV